MTVRIFIWIAALCLLLGAVACGGDDAAPTATASPTPSPTKKPTPTPSASPAPTPTPAPTPAPLQGLDVSGSQTKQGGFLFARYAGAASEPMAYFRATGYTMQQQNGLWYTYIGLATDTPITDYPLEVWEGETLLAAGTVSVVDGLFPRIEFDLPPSSVDLLQDTTRINQERQLVADTVAVYTPAKLWAGAWLMPTEGSISSEFGELRSENGGPYFPHLGTDIANEVGTPVYAAADGTVALSQALLLYGNEVIIDHGVGVYSLYAHMDSSVVAPGQAVTQGQLIGYMGQTGYVTGPHLHWEAIVHGTRVNGGLFTLGATDP